MNANRWKFSTFSISQEKKESLVAHLQVGEDKEAVGGTYVCICTIDSYSYYIWDLWVHSLSSIIVGHCLYGTLAQMLRITAFLCWATLLWLLMDENDHSGCDDWDTARCLNSLACSFPHLVWFCWAFWNRLRSKGTKLPAFTRRFSVFLDLLFFKTPLFSAFKFRLGNRSWDAVYYKIMHTSGFFHILSHKNLCSPNQHSMPENDKVKTTFGESSDSSFSEWFTGSLIKTFEWLSSSRKNVLWLFAQGGFLHPRCGEGGGFFHVLQPGFVAERRHHRTGCQIQQAPPSTLGPHHGEKATHF